MKSEKSRDTILSEREESKFPHGLKIYLTQEELEKMGFKNLPKTGAKFYLKGFAFVSGSSMEGHDFDSDKSLTLQITNLDLAMIKEEPDIDQMFYGKPKEAQQL